MEYLRISKLAETDFDAIIESIGGKRFSPDDTKEKCLNCDYVLADAAIELKLIEENPAAKKSKQKKLANIFGQSSKTVVIDPLLLSPDHQKQYYRVLETPVKTALKKASKQLQSASTNGKNITRIAIIINNGLTLTMPEEFERIAVKCATNDTSGIDILLVGGAYYFSDKFDAYVIFPLKEIFLNGHRQDIVDAIRDGWLAYLNQFMTRQIVDTEIQRDKEPLQDVSFKIGDVLYVKPPPKWGKPSSFWPNGIRPREDTTGITFCPPVATVLPRFDSRAYAEAEKHINDPWKLKGSLRNYSEWVSDVIEKESSLFRPVVVMPVPIKKVRASHFQDICGAATDIFETEIQRIIANASEFTESHQSLNYILLKCVEIGIDKANDISFIEHINEFPGLDKCSRIVEGERLKFEYALAVASAYCLKVGADCVYYLRDEKYKWV
jgi:hypothetical protein